MKNDTEVMGVILTKRLVKQLIKSYTDTTMLLTVIQDYAEEVWISSVLFIGSVVYDDDTFLYAHIAVYSGEIICRSCNSIYNNGHISTKRVCI